MKEISPEHQKRLDAIACYFRELRFSEGFTQKEICLEIDLHPNTLARIENGHNMTLTSMFEISNYYQVPISQIFIDIQ